MRVLVTEDDENLRVAVEGSLRGAGFAVDVAVDLPEADEALSVNTYDCAVFDRMLPSGDSLDYVARRRREGWGVPVLFLTARDSVADRIAGLASGGDDYLVKPFAVVELVARVRSLDGQGVRRPAPPADRGRPQRHPRRTDRGRLGRARRADVERAGRADRPAPRKLGPPPLVHTVRGVGYVLP